MKKIILATAVCLLTSAAFAATMKVSGTFTVTRTYAPAYNIGRPFDLADQNNVKMQAIDWILAACNSKGYSNCRLGGVYISDCGYDTPHSEYQISCDAVASAFGENSN